MISKDDAGTALEIIDAAGSRMLTLKRYAHLAPLLFIWGGVWLVADAVTDFRPDWSAITWRGGVFAGLVASVLMILRFLGGGGFGPANTAAQRKAMRRRFVMLAILMASFFPAMFTVLGPLSLRQGNAFISLCWAFVYMALGAWWGWRLFTIGAIAALAATIGYVAIEQHFYLWMACCGGGSLLAGGLWLRKI